MTKYELRKSIDFRKKFNKLPTEIQERFRKQFKKLIDDPFSIGKPLSFNWFRELKNDKYRVYYIINEKGIVVLLMDLSDKKNQQDRINNIKNNLGSFKWLARDAQRYVLGGLMSMDKETKKLVAERDRLEKEISKWLIDFDRGKIKPKV